MRLNKITSIFLGLLIAVLLSSCGTGSKGVRVTEGREQIGAATPGTVIVSSTSTIVHVDMFERIVTIRNGRLLPDGFVVATNSNGAQTAILKTHPNRPVGLRTADILEGEPSINDSIAPAGSAESQRLSKIYRTPDADSE
jgi:hypothetical protein